MSAPEESLVANIHADPRWLPFLESIAAVRFI